MLQTIHTAIEQGVAWLGAGGPWLFFAAMALLPGLGAPMSVFSLAAGPAFGERMGMGGVVAAGLSAMTANLALTYFLARRALRPPLERLITRKGHKLPQMDRGDAGDVILVMRVSPIPFVIKNYILGLANAPVGKYLAISLAVEGTYSAGMMIFGDAILHGRGKMVLIGLSVIVAAVAITHFARRHFAGRKPAAADVSAN